VTVQMSGRPLPAPIASALVLIGAAMVVFGLAVVGRTEIPGDPIGAIPWIVALVVLVPVWIAYGWHRVRSADRRRRAVAAAEVPATLAEPPSAEDPAVVAAILGKGRVPPVAVAATTLAIARAGWIDVHEVGASVVVSFDDTPSERWTASATDVIVLQALAARRDPTTGDVTGPPVHAPARGWWPAYAADARARAIASGLVEPRIPLVGLMVLCIITATILAIAIFWYTLAFVGLILLANGIPHLIVRFGGYRLSVVGTIERARWLAFGRGLRDRGGLATVGPGGVSMWGPYLVYGVLFGAAPRAAAALTPEGVKGGAELPAGVVVLRD
jgi:hypothetical protein